MSYESEEYCELPANKLTRVTCRFINLSQYVVTLATISVVLVSVTLFVLTAVHSFMVMWRIWSSMGHAIVVTPEFFIDVLEIINGMLKAVIFFIIGIGYFSLFIQRLPICARIGITSLHDLELKVVSVVILIMAVKFLEQFVHWSDPIGTLLFGAALALVTAALLAFQRLVLMNGKENHSK